MSVIKGPVWLGSGDSDFAVCSRDLFAVYALREMGEREREGRLNALSLLGFFLFILGIGSPLVSQQA